MNLPDLNHSHSANPLEPVVFTRLVGFSQLKNKVNCSREEWNLRPWPHELCTLNWANQTITDYRVTPSLFFQLSARKLFSNIENICETTEAIQQMFIKHILMSDSLPGSGIAKVTKKALGPRNSQSNEDTRCKYILIIVITCHHRHRIKNEGKEEEEVIYLFSVRLEGSCQRWQPLKN